MRPRVLAGAMDLFRFIEKDYCLKVMHFVIYRSGKLFKQVIVQNIGFCITDLFSIPIKACWVTGMHCDRLFSFLRFLDFRIDVETGWH